MIEIWTGRFFFFLQVDYKPSGDEASLVFLSLFPFGKANLATRSTKGPLLPWIGIRLHEERLSSSPSPLPFPNVCVDCNPRILQPQQ